jgi:AraC-like DNA-binding protein
MKKKQQAPEIPHYKLNDKFRPLHRDDIVSSFGYNQPGHVKVIKGFELYSSEGLKPTLGPLKSEFYRISITIRGSVDVQLGLEHFRHRAGTISFTFPNQVFSKNIIKKDTFGYYILFNADFLDELIPSITLANDFPFLDYNGVTFLQLSQSEIDTVEALVLKMNAELKLADANRGRAIKMYLYLLLVEVNRSYVRQALHKELANNTNHGLTARFHKLVSQHFLTRRKVADYASLLAVTPNHLNRIVKEVTSKTASETIAAMLIQESKALLKYTDLSVSEISYKLEFNDPASFNRFFKKASGETPQAFRVRQH